jgi:hypothetical protein
LTDCETGPRRQRLNKKLKRGETETLKPEAEDDIIAAEIVEEFPSHSEKLNTNELAPFG